MVTVFSLLPVPNVFGLQRAVDILRLGRCSLTHGLLMEKFSRREKREAEAELIIVAAVEVVSSTV